MTDNNCSKVSMPAAPDSSITKHKKKSKWDQPAECLVSAGIAVHPLGAYLGTSAHHAAALAQKIQPKIQEELIAREIVINDAESSIRSKLTKRQTQEEIQKCTGAIVITRGKYRPPNAPSDGEKPLYLHVSAGTHLETTAERIKAVDQAAAMVEEILKHGALTNGLKLPQPFSTCVFLGFEPDPTLNITARIRGPNDQYVNHIMNETGSTVLLRGRGSGNSATLNPEEKQALHLFLSSSNPKSLEHAKLLAENLLDTICAECGATRISSVKVYGAVPPPQQLAGESTTKITTNSAPSTADFIQLPPASLVTSAVLSNGCSLPSVGYHPSLGHGTSYNGYGGIYPQATPLQQVALALRQSTSPITSTVSATQKIGSTNTSTINEKEKRPPHKRKFQELPAAPNESKKTHQGSGIFIPSEAKSSMPAPVKLVQPSSNGMMPPSPRAMPPPPPPSRTMPPPPPPPPPSRTMPPPPPSSRTMPPPPPRRMAPPPSVTEVVEANASFQPKNKAVPETLISLMAYGDEDDDDIEETIAERVTESSNSLPISKPFWAV